MMNGPLYIKEYIGKTLLILWGENQNSEMTLRNFELLMTHDIKLIILYDRGYEKLSSFCKFQKKYQHFLEANNTLFIDSHKSLNLIPCNYNKINTVENILHAILRTGDLPINEILFLSECPGIMTHSGRLTSIVLKTRIKETISYIQEQGNYDSVLIGYFQMLPFLLEKINKIVFTRGEYLYDEINEWRGKGTMFIDDRKILINKGGNINILKTIYREYVEKGIFRSRTTDEFKKLIGNHYLVSIHNTFLGGFSLTSIGKSALCIECLWVSYMGGGLGNIILNSAQNKAQNYKKTVFLVSADSNLKKYFETNGFQCFGTIKEASNTCKNTDIKNYLQSYPFQRKDSFLYIL